MHILDCAQGVSKISSYTSTKTSSNTALRVQADKKHPDAKVNDEHALMRFEFMEAITRIGIAKYGKGLVTTDPAEAIDMLFTRNILPNLPPHARLQLNEFRNGRLYVEEVDMVLKKHKELLLSLYSRWRLRPPAGGLRTKASLSSLLSHCAYAFFQAVICTAVICLTAVCTVTR